MLTVIFLTCLPCAPAPLPRAEKPMPARPIAEVDLWGYWRADMNWYGIRYQGTVSMGPGGRWEALWNGKQYFGNWRWDSTTLRVEEWTIGEDGPYVWALQPKSDRDGYIAKLGSLALRLRR